ncbi:transmembrane protein 71 isoform X1 [Rhinolophus ferrumequinum]|uniref:Transmembrane protein 71 n=1 Tax=Rhinolophus ferrumequinum TaxID=59479 RepID=A0A671FY21_RHIFE|nr:transmembrane protein 71 isoform X1 [Rhinolophus ferrumequinum]XP_032981657.1 transmembrane protein 71 isoform X1 [Rhinolophus ferrumequinum]XP_032981658.1 transmembrane protein 71 isoform X1 [Rhinolophus ferrumequinum]
MYRISQVMSTPVASKCSSRSQIERAGELSSTCIFPSFACDFLDGDVSFDCCSIDSLTGLACRRSPRLLTNGYYLWTEDSFLCDKDGNITLSPPQTSVTYKENLVRIFRKKKRIRRSFSSFFNLSASKSWLHGSIFDDVDFSPNEDISLEGVSRLDTHHCNENGGDFDCSLTDDRESEKPNAESVKASSSGHVTSQTPRNHSHDVSLQPQWMASEYLPGNILDHSKTSLLGEVSFPTILLTVCLVLSACARWCLGGMLASVFTCSLMITIAYLVKSLCLSLASYFKATACARSLKFDKHQECL